MTDLTGRRILVTGGQGALGSAIVARLSGLGATVVSNDVVEPPASSGLYVRGDAAVPGVASEILDAVADLAGGLADTLCLNAGMAISKPLLDTTADDLARIQRVNVDAAVLLAQEQARRWVAAGEPGLLVFTGSWVADRAWPGIAAYRATKAAIVAWAQSFARELAEHRIRALVVEPGIVGAGMALRQWETEPDYRRRAQRAIPLGALQPLSSVADTFAAVVSPAFSYATGSVITVDGGASLYPMD